MIDLHTHSNCSDGTMSPGELAAAGARAGLSVMALTDHDTTAGVRAFAAAAAAAGVRAVPGVEISAAFGPGTMHLLGYFIDTEHAGLRAALARVRAGRLERNAEILLGLGELGVPVGEEDVAKHAGDGVAGRPHVARALVDRGHARDVQEAFRRWLGKGRSAYVERFKFDPAASIRLLRDAGGVAVLAHPVTLRLPPPRCRELVAALRGEGLGGIEAYHPKHNRVRERQWLRLARDLDLVATGGSDFHGAPSPDVRPGVGFGGMRVPDEVVARLEDRRARAARPAGPAPAGQVPGGPGSGGGAAAGPCV